MHSSLPPLGWHTFLTTWQLAPVWSAVALVALALYVAGLITCRRHGVRAVHPVRVACFVAGLALLLLTVSSAIDVYAMALMWMHMIEHLMLIMVVPALLVLGSPLTLLRAVAATRGREARVDAVLRSGVVTVLTHPAVAVLQYSVVIVATHLTSFMDVMARHDWVMLGEQVLYVVSGYLFMLPLVGIEPIRRQVPRLGRIGLVLLAMTPDTVVGIVMLQANHDLYPTMAAMRPSWAPDSVHDLQTAGALMWVGGDGLMMVIGVGLTIALIAHPGSRDIIGARLEGVRRRTLVEQIGRGETSTSTPDDEVDVDEDDEMLAAYNRMLGRLSQPPTRD
jgi:cytochrome c oxidase assembly factor CtaG